MFFKPGGKDAEYKLLSLQPRKVATPWLRSLVNFFGLGWASLCFPRTQWAQITGFEHQISCSENQCRTSLLPFSSNLQKRTINEGDSKIYLGSKIVRCYQKSHQNVQDDAITLQDSFQVSSENFYQDFCQYFHQDVLSRFSPKFFLGSQAFQSRVLSFLIIFLHWTGRDILYWIINIVFNGLLSESCKIWIK